MLLELLFVRKGGMLHFCIHLPVPVKPQHRSFKVFHNKFLSLDSCLWHRFWFYAECLLSKGMILLLPFQECGDFLVSL